MCVKRGISGKIVTLGSIDAITESAFSVTDLANAISNTGPLILAFQFDSWDLFPLLFARVAIPPACKEESVQQGWANEIQDAAPYLIVQPLTSLEEEQARQVTQAGIHPQISDLAPKIVHSGEAQA